LDEEVSRFLKSGPTKEELGRIKTSSYASFVRDVERIDGSSGKAAILGESQLYRWLPGLLQDDVELAS